MEAKQVHELNESNFNTTVSDGLTLIDFWAPWCGPCRMMTPVLEALAAAEPTVTMGKVNVDENPSLAGQFRVQSIPLLVLMKDGAELKRFVGVQPVASLQKEIRAQAALFGV